MKRLLCSIAFVVLVAASTAPAGDAVRVRYRDDLASAVDRSADAQASDLLSFYKDLHTHPELSEQEIQSARKIAAWLEALGFSVTTGVGGTGVVGLLDNGPGPMVLIRGDMDALPIKEETALPYRSQVQVEREDGSTVGVMHACGHDIHQTCLVGTAKALTQLRSQWRGRLMVIAQPAEETGKGARMMLEDGLFDRFGRPDYCIALHVSAGHPAGVVSYTPGWALANVDSVDVTIYGRGGHGSRPNETVDPVVIASHVVVALQTIVSRRVHPREPAVITVGSIHAGSKHNIISNEAKLQITVRSYADETRKLLLDSIAEVTINTARALGAERDPIVAFREEEFTPSTFNDPALTEAAAGVFRAVLGDERVVEQDAVMGGEDFGRFPQALDRPGLIFWLGSVRRDIYDASQKPDGSPLPSLHSSKYFPDPAPTIKTGVRCLTSLALSLLEKQ